MLTVAEVIKILKISRATLYRMIERGEIRVYKFGRNTRFRHEDIEAFIEAHEKK